MNTSDDPSPAAPSGTKTEPSSAVPVPFAYWVALGAAVFVSVGGSISFAGWVFDVYRFMDWWDTGIWIKVNTAAALMTAGFALLVALRFPNAQVVVRSLGLGVASIGALTLFEHLVGVNLGIDTFLFDEAPGAAATVAPGRMGPPASISLTALGLALYLSRGKRLERRWSVGLALPVLAICVLSLTGYWYGATAMYTIPKLTAISLQTATMLAALSVGIVTLLPDHEPSKTLFEQSDSGNLARRLLTAAFAVPMLLGWLRVTGQRYGLFDYLFGAALRTVFEIAMLTAAVWWSVRTIREREIARERAERERRSSELRMRLVLEASAVPFLVLSPVKDHAHAIVDFSWTYVNRAAATCLQRSTEQLIGRRFGVEFPKVWQEPGLFDALLGVVLHKEIREFQSQFSPDDTRRWFKLVASPLEDQIAVWFADVTEAKHQELELRAADRRKDEFLATLAHELRNPLAPIRQAALVVNKSGATELQRRWSGDVIERQVQHMSLLLDDLIDVSRITRGKLELRRGATQISPIIESAVETSRPLFERKSHTLKLDIPDEPVVVEVDSLRLAQIVANLLNNAAKYTDPGGVIALSASLNGDSLVIQVSDNGIGIEREQLAEIFKMFAQVKSAQAGSEGGLGIGLALTKGLVELHGGTITAESAGLMTGSTFTVTFPEATAQATAVAARTDKGLLPSRSRRILLADDNRDAAQSLAMLLRFDGHQVEIVHDGASALSAFESVAPEVVLLDIGMPVLSGYEVATRIRAKRAPAVLIAITGWGQSHDRAKAFEAGFDHHMTKPVDYERLTALLSGITNDTHPPG